jgi:hypothetical protein
MTIFTVIATAIAVIAKGRGQRAEGSKGKD